MTSLPTDSIDTRPGYRIYSRFTLGFYDLAVHGISNRWLWNCPTAKLQRWFDQHVSENHLDVGVGTGYFLDRTKRFAGCDRIGLLDANENCLKVASRRISRYEPEVIKADLGEPFADKFEPFRSLSLMYVLHCLPGDTEFRRIVLRHCMEALQPEGCLFGATILGQPQPNGWLGRYAMTTYNRKGVFDNSHDTIESLRTLLDEYLDDVTIEQIGSVAVFAGRRS